MLQEPRDTFTVGVINETESTVSGFGVASSAGNYGGTYGQVSWQHDLSPRTSTNLFVQYGTDSTQFGGTPGTSNNVSEQFYAVNATLSHALSQTLTSYASYSLSSRFGSAVVGRNYLENIALVGLRKAF